MKDYFRLVFYQDDSGRLYPAVKFPNKEATRSNAIARSTVGRIVMVDTESMFAYFISSATGPLVIYVREDLLE